MCLMWSWKWKIKSDLTSHLVSPCGFRASTNYFTRFYNMTDEKMSFLFSNSPCLEKRFKEDDTLQGVSTAGYQTNSRTLFDYLLCFIVF